MIQLKNMEKKKIIYWERVLIKKKLEMNKGTVSNQFINIQTSIQTNIVMDMDITTLRVKDCQTLEIPAF